MWQKRKPEGRGAETAFQRLKRKSVMNERTSERKADALFIKDGSMDLDLLSRAAVSSDGKCN